MDSIDRNFDDALGARHKASTEFEKALTQRLSVRSALALKYAAEVKIFKAQHGGLEDIRKKLNYSRRKMCQLLMVDPSAWTRWAKDDTRVPPHVYRSLEWFLALNERALTHPELAAVFTNRYQASRVRDASGNDLGRELASLKAELRRQRQVILMLIAGLTCLGLTLGWFLVGIHAV